ncbi:MarR family winged helix-turn-helix transcriptional regulator [Actinomycetes bacterium M1A6_2h]
MDIADDPIGTRLQAVATLSQRMSANMADHLGVNATDLAAMQHLIDDGPLTSTELAGRLEVTTAASTHIVDRLEKAGHVSRERHPTDRRKLMVTPAGKSVDAAYAHLAPMLTGLESVISDLTDDERAVVENFLGRVVDVFTSATTESEDQ